MVYALLRLVARLPLRVLHGMGSLLGRVIYLSDRRYAARMRENLAGSRLFRDDAAYRSLLRMAIGEAGKGLLELAPVWLRPEQDVLRLVREVRGWDLVAAALAQGRGLVLLTPHLGCFEIAAQYIASRVPITALYRPPRLSWLEPVMNAGRNRGQARLVPTNMKGVRALIKALRAGEAIGILPDQVPAQGDGVWAEFFGRPAYTMTLAAKLAHVSDAPVILVAAFRLPHGAGYQLQFTALDGPLAEDETQATQQINRALEALIRQQPAQYLWSYNRYKQPRGKEAAAD
jgi:Kdo2-lipid IVA lauroyltransferase/acyltransferase